uniref:Uncharacterized protein n=1 Tax=Panagrolaimus davidi TaxID=227884 RepID=A0A914PHA9_9BILA
MANVVPVEALNLPQLSDPKFVEYFRETKDQNLIIHFYNCFKNIDTTNFDKEIHENSKEMIKIIIHQRREFGERCLAADDMKNKIEEKLIQLMKENIELNQKLAEEYVANNNLKSELEAVNGKYLKAENEKAQAIELSKKENELLTTIVQRTKKEKETLEKEIRKLENGKSPVETRKDGRHDQSGSLLRKGQHIARKITRQAYITSTPLTAPAGTGLFGRRQSQTCIQQQQFCTRSSTSIFKRSTYTTATTTTSMNHPQQQPQQSQSQQQQSTGFPSLQQTRQFMSCIRAQALTTTSNSAPTSAATETKILNVSAIPLPPPQTSWISNSTEQFSSIPMDPFYSIPTMMPPPTMPQISPPVSELSPSQQQQYYLQ